jgi:hypothetical protein
LVVLAIVVTAGAVLWVFGNDSSKTSALGTTLMGSGVVGAVLVFVERALSARTEAVEKTVGLGPAPPPITDTSSPEPDAGPPAEGERHERPEGERHFAVRYMGWDRDTSRIDAYLVRLRVLKNSDYFQFFTAIIPGFDVVLAEESGTPTMRQFRRAFTDVAVEQIRQRIERGEAPLNDPNRAIELQPDPDEARRQAGSADDIEYAEGEIVAEFDL